MMDCGNRAAAPRSSVRGGRVRLILVGNPNCGKSTLFNALTGAHAVTGNWHGVTVGAAAHRADLDGVPAEICDLPGVYSLRPYSMEEKAACRAIEAGDYDLAVCVADALTLPRSLALVRDLARGRPAVLVVTMLDLLEGRGGRLNAAGLSARLGIPVLAVSAHKRADIARLRAFLRKEAERAARVGASERAAAAPSVGASEHAAAAPSVGASERAAAAPGVDVSSGKAAAVRRGGTRESGTDRGGGCAARLGGEEALGADVYRPGGKRSALADRLFYDPRFALPLFAACLLAVFFLAFAEGMPGMLCKGAFEGLLADGVGGRLASLAEGAGAPVAADFLHSFFGSVGMVLSFLPQIVLLELALALLEESGLLSAVAFLTDGIFRRAGLTGRAAFSLLMGFGCTAAAILTTRGLENKPLQRRVVAILGYISCGAKMPVYLTVAAAFFPHPFLAVVALYAAGLLLAFAAALLLRRLIPGEEEFVLEMAHPQRPRLRPVLRSLLFSAKQFIIKVATVVTAFLAALWVLLSFTFTFRYVGAGSGESMLALGCRAFSFLFYPMGVTQWQVALAALAGIVAKESVAGTLALFYGEDLSAAFTPASAVAFLTFILTCSPCVSAVAAAAREVGVRRALGMAAAQTGVAFGISYLVYGLLCAGALAASLLAAALPALLFFLHKRDHEKIFRPKKPKAERVHRRDVRAGLLRPRPPSARAGDPRQRRAHGQRRPARRGG